MSRVSWRIAAVLAALTLVVAMLFSVGGASAAPITDQSVMTSLYFPWIPNGETLAGAGPWSGAVTLQNLESVPVGVAFNSTSNTVKIPAQSSISLSAGTLGIAAPGGQLVATASWDASQLPPTICTAATTIATQTVIRGTPNGADTVTLPSNVTFTSTDMVTVSYGSTTYVQNTDYKVVPVNAQTFNIDWSPPGAEPPTGATYTVTVAAPPDCSRAPFVAGAEKQALPSTPGNLQTSGSQTTVDGYTALDANQLASTIYLPIVQLNNNWDSIIHVSNPTTTDTTVSLTLTVASNLTSGGNVSQSYSVAAGETAVIDLANLVPAGWVGSAELTAASGDPATPSDIVALVDRVKPTTQMALINVAEPAGSATSSAALVFRSYQDWKTGINLSNITNAANTVTITYYNPDGSVLTTDSVTLPADGMEFVYLPDEATTASFAGSAVLSGQSPFLVALDEVKYTTNLEAMSYLATDQQAVASMGDMLALPIVQKGDPTTGLGDTSGLNLFNPSSNPVTFTVTYFDVNGNQVTSTTVSLSAHQSDTLYTLDQAALPTGFQGSAVVAVTGGSGNLVAVSNNVNYAVPGDGSSVYSLELITPPSS